MIGIVFEKKWAELARSASRRRPSVPVCCLYSLLQVSEQEKFESQKQLYTGGNILTRFTAALPLYNLFVALDNALAFI